MGNALGTTCKIQISRVIGLRVQIVSLEGSNMQDVSNELRDRAERICAHFGWQLNGLLGQGGSAAVFEVRRSDGPAALKIFFNRFIEGREGDVTRRRLQIVKDRLIGHECPRLVQVYKVDDFDGAPFMLMQRVEGTVLTEVLRLVPPDGIESIVRQVAMAVKYLADIGITHRDIKSDNIIIDASHRLVTLVDVGVARIIEDPIGSGTDDDGQLPFVATARYSSPEYMFRLMPSGPELWQALSFYQLGGLIHDLLAGEQLFEDIVRQASGNRYLVAYAVATKIPSIPLRSDVPDYLLTLAQRCLQKDPVARLASVSWEDFLTRDRLRENEMLLGLRGEPIVQQRTVRIDIADVARSVERALDERLVSNGVSCRHSRRVVNHAEAEVKIDWRPPGGWSPQSDDIQAVVGLRVVGDQIELSAKATHSSRPAAAIPAVSVDAGGKDWLEALNRQAYDRFIEVSAAIAQREGSDQGNQE